MKTEQQSGRSGLALIAAMVTVVVVIAGIAALALEQLASNRGHDIETAPHPALTTPIVCAVLLAIAIGWLWWLVRRFGWRHVVTMIAAGATALLLVLTPLLTWQALTSDRSLTITTMTCDAEALRVTGGSPLANCVEQPVDAIVLLQGVESKQQWAPDTVTDNLAREFGDLPAGSWATRLVVDGPPETVAVAAIGIEDDEDDDAVRLGDFRPSMDAESGQLRWSALIPVDTDIASIRVLFYLSANPAVESARVRFDVRACIGQTLRTFDATQCDPMPISAPLVSEQPPDRNRTWRQPRSSVEESAVVLTNLEARTYQLQPDFVAIEMVTQSTDVLIIPAAMPQVTENSVVTPGQASFEVSIDATTGELVYVVYVFPSGPTYAGGIPQHR